MNFTIFGGRKFAMAMGAAIVTTALQWFGKLDPSGTTYAAVILGTVGAYITAGTIDNLKAAKEPPP